NHTNYRAHPFGAQLRYPSRSGVPVSGLAIPEEKKLSTPVQTANGQIVRTFVENHLALRPAGRMVDRDEAKDLVADGRVKADAVCGVTGRGAGAPEDRAIIEFAGRYYNFCRPAHAVQFNNRLMDI